MAITEKIDCLWLLLGIFCLADACVTVVRRPSSIMLTGPRRPMSQTQYDRLNDQALSRIGGNIPFYQPPFHQPATGPQIGAPFVNGKEVVPIDLELPPGVYKLQNAKVAEAGQPAVNPVAPVAPLILPVTKTPIFQPIIRPVDAARAGYSKLNPPFDLFEARRMATVKTFDPNIALQPGKVYRGHFAKTRNIMLVTQLPARKYKHYVTTPGPFPADWWTTRFDSLPKFKSNPPSEIDQSQGPVNRLDDEIRHSADYNHPNHNLDIVEVPYRGDAHMTTPRIDYDLMNYGEYHVAEPNNFDHDLRLPLEESRIEYYQQVDKKVNVNKIAKIADDQELSSCRSCQEDSLMSIQENGNEVKLSSNKSRIEVSSAFGQETTPAPQSDALVTPLTRTTLPLYRPLDNSCGLTKYTVPQISSEATTVFPPVPTAVGEPIRSRMNEFPWQVWISIQHEQMALFGSAVIINDNWLLSSASFLRLANDMTDAIVPLFGLHDAEHVSFSRNEGVFSVPVASVHFHPSLDFALIKLVAPLNMSRMTSWWRIQPICLPAPCGAADSDDVCQTPGQTAWIAGWHYNLQDNGLLRKIKAAIAPRKKCEDGLGKEWVTEDKLCTEGADVCRFGYSGQLVARFPDGNSPKFALCGLATVQDCRSETPSRLGVFSRVCAALDWIYNITGTTTPQLIDDDNSQLYSK